jgi:hypothetical protein
MVKDIENSARSNTSLSKKIRATHQSSPSVSSTSIISDDNNVTITPSDGKRERKDALVLPSSHSLSLSLSSSRRGYEVLEFSTTIISKEFWPTLQSDEKFNLPANIDASMNEYRFVVITLVRPL